MICAPAKSLEPTMIAGLLPVELLPLLEPPDDPHAASTRTEPMSIAPSARPLNRTLVFRMVPVPFRRVAAGSAGWQTLRVGRRFQLDRRDRDPRAGGDTGVRPGSPRTLPIVRLCTHAQTPRDDEVLDEREGQLDRDGEQRDEECTGEESLVVVDARTVVDVAAQ